MLFYKTAKHYEEQIRPPEKPPERKAEKREKRSVLEDWSQRKAVKPLQSSFYAQQEHFLLAT